MFTLSIVANVLLGAWVLALSLSANRRTDESHNKMNNLEKELESLKARNRELEEKEQVRQELEDQNLKLDAENRKFQSQRQFVMNVLKGLPIPDKYVANVRTRLYPIDEET